MAMVYEMNINKRCAHTHIVFFFKNLDSAREGGNKWATRGQGSIEGGVPIPVAFALRIHNYAWKSKKTGSLKISKRE